MGGGGGGGDGERRGRGGGGGEGGGGRSGSMRGKTASYIGSTGLGGRGAQPFITITSETEIMINYQITNFI